MEQLCEAKNKRSMPKKSQDPSDENILEEGERQEQEKETCTS